MTTTTTKLTRSANSYLTPIALACATLALLAGYGGGGGSDAGYVTAQLQDKVQNIVVIYAENRSFDNLFGNFPGPNGLSSVVDAN